MMKVDTELLRDADRGLPNFLVNAVNGGYIDELEIIGDGWANAYAVGKLLDIDPTLLAPSKDKPPTIHLYKGNTAYATFQCARFLDNRRLNNWFHMVNEGKLTPSPSTTVPPIHILPPFYQPTQGQ